MIKAQLPVGQTFRGVPYCKGDDAVKPGAEIVAWTWATDTEDLSIFVTGPSIAVTKNEIEFRWQPVTDGNGRDGCTAPLPDSFGAVLLAHGSQGSCQGHIHHSTRLSHPCFGRLGPAVRCTVSHCYST
jgi:hypothetical protein